MKNPSVYIRNNNLSKNIGSNNRFSSSSIIERNSIDVSQSIYNRFNNNNITLPNNHILTDNKLSNSNNINFDDIIHNPNSKRYSYLFTENHFEDVIHNGQNKIICNHCRDNGFLKFYAEGISTILLNKHLSNKHKIHSVNSDTIMKLMLEALIECNLPFSILNNSRIRKILNYAGMNMNMDRHYVGSLISKITINLKKSLNEIIKNSEHVCLIIDSWSSGDRRFIGVAATVLNLNKDKHTLKSLLLRVESVIESNAYIVKKVIENTFNEYKESNIKNKVKFAITDGGTEIKSALEMLNIKRFWCINHIISLSIKDGLKEESIQIFWEKINNISKHVRSSAYARGVIKDQNRILKKIHQKLKVTLKLDFSLLEMYLNLLHLILMLL